MIVYMLQTGGTATRYLILGLIPICYVTSGTGRLDLTTV